MNKKALSACISILAALAALIVLAAIVKKGAFTAVVIALCAAALLAAAGLFVLGNVIADRVVHQNKGKDTHENSKKQLEIWGFDLNGFLNAHEETELTFKAEDGVSVPASLFEQEGENCAVLVHSAGGDRMSIYPLAAEYLKMGWSVIAIDQRGSGKSEDTRVTFGINESRDVPCAVKYARETLKKSHVIVHGQSMGAQTAAMYASKLAPDDPNAADAIICDSPLASMETILKSAFADGRTDSFKAKLFWELSRIVVKLRYGIKYADGETIEAVKTDRLPTLIILSEKDKVCLPDDVERMYENVAAETKELVRVDCGHIRWLVEDPERYMRKVKEFVGKVGIRN